MQALMVMEMQNDMYAAERCLDRLGLVDTVPMGELARRLETLLEQARKAGARELHTRTAADIETLPASMVRRMQRFGRDGYPRAGSRVAAHCGPAAAADAQVVTKRGCGAFPGTDPDERLSRVGVHRLALAGVFADICIDAAARIACQLFITPFVLFDAILALDYESEQSLSLTERFYRVRIVSTTEWVAEVQGAALDFATGA